MFAEINAHQMIFAAQIQFFAGEHWCGPAGMVKLWHLKTAKFFHVLRVRFE